MKNSFKNILTNQSTNALNALNIINLSICLNCFITLNSLGIIKFFKKDGFTTKYYSNTTLWPLINSIINTLRGSNLIIKYENKYFLTDLGLAICDKIGLIKMLYSGYGKLIASQHILSHNTKFKTSKYIDAQAVANASTNFSSKDLEIIYNKFFNKKKLKGTICDLGCGNSKKLFNLCSKFGNKGLGIEYDKALVYSTIEKLKASKKAHSLEIIQGDITNLNIIRKDVEIVMQHYVFHDFVPLKYCSKLLSQIKINFPNMKYFLYLDIVASTEDSPKNMPGFEYVHGLMNKQMRTLEETHKLFENSQYQVIEQHPIDDMPCTYVWILKPIKTNNT